MMTAQRIGFNEFFDRKRDVLWIIPGQYALAWGLILSAFALLWVTIAQLIDEPWLLHAVMPVLTVVALIIYAVLTRNGEHTFLGEFHKPKQTILTNQRLFMTRTQLKPKLATKTDPFTKEKLNAIENGVDIVAPFEIDLEGYETGGYLLERDEKLTFVFAYELTGESSNLSPEDATTIADRLGEGLKDFHFNESLSIHYGSFSSASDEVANLHQLIEQSSREEVQFLLGWRIQKAKRLAENQKNNPKTLRLYFSFTPEQGGDSIEETLFNIAGDLAQLVLPMVRAVGLAPKQQSVTNTLHSKMRLAFDEGFLNQKYFLEKLGLNTRPLTWSESWKSAWKKLNNSAPLDCPLVIRLDDSGLHFDRSGEIVRDKNGHIISSDPMVASRLFNAGSPKFEKDCLFLPGRSQWCGGLVWNSKPSIAWESDQRIEQLRYGVKPIFQSNTYDTEIIVEFTRVHHSDAKRTAQAITSETNFASNTMLSSGVEDRGVVREKSLAVAADDALRGDTRLIKVAWMAIAYRRTKRELNQALNLLASNYAGDVLTREEGYFSSLWAESLPFSARNLLSGGSGLTHRFERRIQDSTHSVLGFLPLLADSSKDKQGLKFLSESGTPLYFDPFRKNPHGHTISTGFTGSGKTVLMGAIAAHSACSGYKTFIFDASKDGNVGAIEPLIRFLDGAYFDPSQECSNLFQGADWRKMDGEKRGNGVSVFQTFLVGSLRDLSVGSTLPKDQARIVKDLLVFLVTEYLNKPETVALYHAAFDQGMGSDAWAKMPTLTTWLDWVSPDRLPIEMKSEEAIALLNRVKGSLIALMRRPAGKAIASPSTFDTSNNFIAFKVDTKGDDDDLLPLVLSAQSAVMAGCLESSRTYVAYDEVSRLFPKFPSLADTAADLMAMGRSLGIWLNLVGQTLQPIYNCPQRDDIFENVKTYLTGFITTDAIDGLKKRSIPPHLVNAATRDSFVKTDGRKRWIVSQGSSHWVGDLHVDPALLALLGNSPEEKALRQEFIDASPDKMQWVHAYAKALFKK